MSLFDDASLVYIPTGYKATKNYSGKPSTGGADMTFSRASGATRVNSKGLVEKVRTNLLTYSEDFSTSAGWSASGSVSATANYGTAPNGTNTSTQIVFTGGSQIWRKTVSGINGNLGVFSLWIKGVAGETIVITYGGTDKVLTLTGNWTRFYTNGNIASSAELFINTFVSATARTIEVWGGQAEVGSVATDYIPTTSAAVSVGPVNDEPRLTYDPVNPTAPSLLMEPQRTNLITYSEYFGASNWILDGSAITTNATTSPEGVANATKLEGDGSSVNVRLYDSYTYPSTGDYTFSVYAKAGTNDFVLIAILGVDGGKARYFDLVNGIAGSADSKIEAIGTDGWYRCSFTTTLTGPDTTGNFNIYVPYSIDTNSFPTAGDANGQNVYIWGAQLEAASYPTSYIPTNGTSVTRVVDRSFDSGLSGVIGQTEGVLFLDWYMEHESSSASEDLYTVALSDGTSNNTIGINNYNNTLAVFVNNGGVSQFYNNSFSGSDGQRIKLALAYKENDFALYINGAQIATDSSGTIPSLTNINVAAWWTGGLNDFIKLNKLLLFPTRIDNATLATLTSL